MKAFRHIPVVQDGGVVRLAEEMEWEEADRTVGAAGSALLLGEPPCKSRSKGHFCFLLQVGDGTTSVTLLAAEFLKQIKPYVEEGLHPQIIIRAFRTATQLVRVPLRPAQSSAHRIWEDLFREQEQGF